MALPSIFISHSNEWQESQSRMLLGRLSLCRVSILVGRTIFARLGDDAILPIYSCHREILVLDCRPLSVSIHCPQATNIGLKLTR